MSKKGKKQKYLIANMLYKSVPVSINGYTTTIHIESPSTGPIGIMWVFKNKKSGRLWLGDKIKFTEIETIENE